MQYDLVFEGGGAKGMAFVGAYQEFVGRGHTCGRLLGTSAGAITAAAVAAGHTSFRGVAVVTSSSPAAAPCGACRQVLAEFGDFPVVLAGLDGDQRTTTVLDLLPMAFLPQTLANDS